MKMEAAIFNKTFEMKFQNARFHNHENINFHLCENSKYHTLSTVLKFACYYPYDTHTHTHIYIYI
jgi:hypothetical protein